MPEISPEAQLREISTRLVDELIQITPPTMSEILSEIICDRRW